MTREASFQTADRDSFEEMVKPERYSARSPAFDQWISATANHYWDPGDKAYIDFDTPFDLEKEMILPPELIPELNCAVKDRLDEGQQIAFANESTRFMVSSLLHGEQGALSLSASLCSILVDPGTQEFATNQVREEARHVRAFSGYIQSRFGTPLSAGSTLENILKGVVNAPEIYKKFVGMQLLVEGFAMGACTVLYTKANDPVLRRLAQLVMTDESFHHKFGQVWADQTIPSLSEQEHAVIEGWAAQTFQMLFMNLMTAEQRRAIYPRFGLEWEWVFGAIREALTDKRKRELMAESSNMFRVVIKTLHRAGIITDRTRPMYAAWVDMSALAKEGDEMVGDAIAEDGMKFLFDINSNRAPRHLRPAKS